MFAPWLSQNTLQITYSDVEQIQQMRQGEKRTFRISPLNLPFFLAPFFGQQNILKEFFYPETTQKSLIAY